MIDNTIVMYLIVRKSLNMTIGKTSAQVGHAVQMIMEAYNYLLNQFVRDSCSPKDELTAFTMREWCQSSYAKVVLEADEKEWVKLKEELKDDIFLVRDNGLTELKAETETVIGLFPMHKSQRPRLIKRLQTLK